MTHCAGYRAAAVARSCDIYTVGIDAEPNQPLPSGVLDAIALAPEQHMLSQLAAADRATCWDRLLFCAKEAIYKAWFPVAHRWLGFEDVVVTIEPAPPDPAHGTFTARVLVPGIPAADHLLTRLDGHWLCNYELVLTTLAVSAQR